MENLFQNDLILLKRLEDFYALFYVQFKKLPKRDRFALGLKIENLIIEMLKDLYKYEIKATPKETKEKILHDFDINLSLLKYYFRLLFTNHVFNQDKYTFFETKLLELGKILGGLLKKYSPPKEESKKNSSGEANAQIVVRIVRSVPVHIQAVGIEVADIDEVGVALILSNSICSTVRKKYFFRKS